MMEAVAGGGEAVFPFPVSFFISAVFQLQTSVQSGCPGVRGRRTQKDILSAQSSRFVENFSKGEYEHG